MKKITLLIAAAAAVVLASCSKADGPSENSSEEAKYLTITCSFPETLATKVTLSGLEGTGSPTPAWEETDNIQVVETNEDGDPANPSTSTSTTINGDGSATFSFSNVSEEYTPAYVAYPDAKPLTVGAQENYFDEQIYNSTVGYDKSKYYFWASLEESPVKLAPLYPMLLLRLKGEVKIGKIELWVNIVDTPTRSYTLTCESAVQLNTGTATLFGVVMSRVKNEKYTIKFYDENGVLICSKITKKMVAFQLMDGDPSIRDFPEITIEAAAPATTGTAKAKLTAGSNVETDVTWVQLWENGPKWATINVGVTDPDATGTDLYGGLYRWGGTNNMRADTSLGDDHNDGSADLTHTGDDPTDTATKLWGSNWRMPTQAELNQLRNYADDGSDALETTLTEWSSASGGYTITGKGAYASNSIFLPAAGYFTYSNGNVSSEGDRGDYWSSTKSSSNNAYYLDSYSDGQDVDSYNRMDGYSVRPVLVE